jgi:hypothetical protein
MTIDEQIEQAEANVAMLNAEVDDLGEQIDGLYKTISQLKFEKNKDKIEQFWKETDYLNVDWAWIAAKGDGSPHALNATRANQKIEELLGKGVQLHTYNYWADKVSRPRFQTILPKKKKDGIIQYDQFFQTVEKIVGAIGTISDVYDRFSDLDDEGLGNCYPIEIFTDDLSASGIVFLICDPNGEDYYLYKNSYHILRKLHGKATLRTIAHYMSQNGMVRTRYDEN